MEAITHARLILTNRNNGHERVHLFHALRNQTRIVLDLCDPADPIS